ncbi:extracellular solute-binding protein [Pelagibacterium lentulum]|uniref:ABC transporter substrate-binding protein n=1 Tax=Pelagibacterium lentulum TaxID=2029865 RepID=A0A916VXD4_9HYPH|nr:extracellular solute-binding protein [Pelagibacterium lentulum]GGA49280.1 ABC transporter substrate-binding protein [Pelagibacterium lentulum]
MQALRLAMGLAIASMIAISLPASAQDEMQWRHATSLTDEVKYPEGFAHFDYVNPDAPKGGTVRLNSLQTTFDSFNPVLPEGQAASGLGLVYETLMTSSLDELYTQYGLLAEAMAYPDDYSSVTYRMNPNARWHDGEPVTVDDVLWSFEMLLEISPFYQSYYANVTDVEITGEQEITFSFDETGNRELPHIMGQMLVLPKHWWEGENAEGQQRDIRRSTLEPPLGSGPYRLDSFVAGRSVTYARVEDYWGIDEPVNIGTNNFDTYRVEYFRDLTVAFEAFKADTFDWWSENQARRWATAYDFPAVNEGRIIREEFDEPYRSSGVMVGFVMNMRDEKFQHPRVREALNYAFDFEELNRTIFFDQYERIDSFFFGSDLRHDGLPEGRELEILEDVRDSVPEEVFTRRYTNPIGGTEEARRENLREALRLFAEAGYTLDGTRLVNENGEQFGFEILLNGPTIEPVAMHLAENLNTIGANVTVRSVDSPQFTNRVRSFDYDVVYTGWAQSMSPGNEQRDYWGTSSVNADGSRNYAGISNPGVDALIDRIIFAEDRETLEAASMALDRVLLAQHFIVPSYVISYARIARWDRFSHPDPLPYYAIGFPDIWWWDEEKAAATGGASR